MVGSLEDFSLARSLFSLANKADIFSRRKAVDDLDKLAMHNFFLPRVAGAFFKILHPLPHLRSQMVRLSQAFFFCGSFDSINVCIRYNPHQSCRD